jgi:hypothetical protein
MIILALCATAQALPSNNVGYNSTEIASGEDILGRNDQVGPHD